MKVQVIGLEEGKISLSAKKLKPDPWSIIPERFRVGDVIDGEVVKFVPYGAFVRMYDDINGLIHLSELDYKPINNASEMLKMGQVVRAKVILIDIDKRKI
jgi:ribosomal protein S1